MWMGHLHALKIVVVLFEHKHQCSFLKRYLGWNPPTNTSTEWMLGFRTSRHMCSWRPNVRLHLLLTRIDWSSCAWFPWIFTFLLLGWQLGNIQPQFIGRGCSLAEIKSGAHIEGVIGAFSSVPQLATYPDIQISCHSRADCEQQSPVLAITCIPTRHSSFDMHAC